MTCFNCSSRLSESPSNNSTDAALGGTNAHPTGSEWDSDMEVEADYLPDWQSSVPPDKLASLHPHEKKRQDVINGKLSYNKFILMNTICFESLVFCFFGNTLYTSCFNSSTL